jgi:hypothetical protein
VHPLCPPSWGPGRRAGHSRAVQRSSRRCRAGAPPLDPDSRGTVRVSMVDGRGRPSSERAARGPRVHRAPHHPASVTVPPSAVRALSSGQTRRRASSRVYDYAALAAALLDPLSPGGDVSTARDLSTSMPTAP